MEDKFVGRDNLVHQIRALFNETQTTKKLRIQSIEGSGGLGKSTLLEHAITPELLADHHYLCLKIDGHHSQNDDIYDLVSALIHSASSAVTRHKKSSELFPKTSNVIKAYQAFKLQLIKAYMEKDPSLNPEKISDYLRIGLQLGDFVNQAFPHSQQHVQFSVIHDQLQHQHLFQKLDQLADDLNVMRKEGVSRLETLLSSLSISSNVSLRNAFRERSLRPLAQALVEDLSAILYKAQKRFDVAPSKIKGIDRLLVIIDDFEALQPTLLRFLTENLLHELKKSEFESLLFILGRDNLSNTSPDWQQHFENSQQPAIRLKHLNQEQVYALAGHYGIDEPKILEQIWQDTEGYPYYIQLWIAEVENGGVTATSLKQFYVRMTRWLSAVEKSWLQKIVYLNVINISNIRHMGFSADEAQHIMVWFENEASLRDTQAKHYQFRPFVQRRILDYLKINDPELFLSLSQQAQHVEPALLQCTE